MKYLITVKRASEEPNMPETIYEQSVEALNLKALIDVVNAGLKVPRRDKGKPRSKTIESSL